MKIIKTANITHVYQISDKEIVDELNRISFENPIDGIYMFHRPNTERVRLVIRDNKPVRKCWEMRW